MIYKTRAIIIKRTNLGEADKIVTIYSENLGKIKTIAKGVRKIRSKLAGNLELFCLSDLNLAEGRNLDIITSAVIDKCYFNLRNNLQSTKNAYYFGEIVDKLTEEKDVHPEIFTLLDNVLENLNSIQSNILIPYFEWNFSSEIGYHPELYFCIICRKKIAENDKNYFDFDRGGLICNNCNKGSLAISIPAIKLLRLFLKHQLQNLSKINLDQKTLIEVKNITRNYLNYKAEKDFKSQKFL